MIYNKRKNQCHMRGWEEERALLGERVWQRVGEFRPPEPTTDPHFLTKTCLAHSHSPSRVLYCKPQNGLGLSRVRSSICFSAPILQGYGFRAAQGAARSKVRLGHFPRPGFPSLIC